MLVLMRRMVFARHLDTNCHRQSQANEKICWPSAGLRFRTSPNCRNRQNCSSQRQLPLPHHTTYQIKLSVVHFIESAPFNRLVTPHFPYVGWLLLNPAPEGTNHVYGSHLSPSQCPWAIRGFGGMFLANFNNVKWLFIALSPDRGHKGARFLSHGKIKNKIEWIRGAILVNICKRTISDSFFKDYKFAAMAVTICLSFASPSSFRTSKAHLSSRAMSLTMSGSGVMSFGLRIRVSIVKV